MAKTKVPQEIITNTNFSEQPINRDYFENFEFVNCIFPDLSNLNFIACTFKNCNLSNVKASQTMMQECEFKDCKLMGLHFSSAKDFAFEVHFENCILDYASFDRKKLNKSSFKNCKMHGTNLTQSDLSKTTFSNCDFYEALFSGTNLTGVDLRNSINFLIDPEQNKIKKAKFSLQSLPGLLYRHDIVVEE